MTEQGRVIYFINGLTRGGAEIGLRSLLENGLFEGYDFRVIILHRGSAELRREVGALAGEDRIIEASTSPKLTIRGCVIGMYLLFRTIVTFRPDSVILSLKQANIIGRFVLYAFPKVKCIAFEHIAELERGPAVALYSKLLRLTSGRVDSVWADCTTTLNATRVYFKPRPREEKVVPLFLASDEAPLKSCYELSGPARIVTAGRLVSRKRVDLLLKTIRILADRGRIVVLTIYGEGPMKSAFQQLANELGIGQQVEFAGFKHKWYADAAEHDLFIHMSDEEGFCIVVAEAMMVGLPVIANAVGGIRDYSCDGRTAVHLASMDPQYVADIIGRHLDCENHRQYLGNCAAGWIKSTYRRERVKELYRSVEF
ncbi:glycosyltransferase [Tardiphaga sp. 42S5]|uniref:glycosyltransferase n=1 Tax=Tardiphaga sp. 42S5 TaxID=1404799 RepID=UPI002A5AAC0E|nr:glycosyltransferase [Tardiphaga sp. 42S5]WPO40418.1 glycosyltransferase [Tardiphaga sp. 42S5]